MKRKLSSTDGDLKAESPSNISIKEDFCGENSDDRNKKKKVRTTFTGRQIFELEKMFETKKYLSSTERTELAKLLNVTEQQVFHSSIY